jgi:hypothetical protein
LVSGVSTNPIPTRSEILLFRSSLWGIFVEMTKKEYGSMLEAWASFSERCILALLFSSALKMTTPDEYLKLQIIL